MDTLQTLMLGVVQGIGEFLPISSSANLAVVSKIFKFATCSFETKVALHAGSLLALIFYFRQTLWRIFLGLFTNKVKLSQTAFYTMVIATLPVVIIGSILHRFIKGFDSNIITGILLIVFGILLWLSDIMSVNKLAQRCTKSTHVRDCLIGVFQSMAILPGVSRLGICTTACRLFNINRKQAITTSLLLAIPSIAGSLCIELFTIFKDDAIHLFNRTNLIGMLVSGIVGIMALPICIKYMENHGFFGIMCYRILLGLTVIFAL